MVVLCIFQISKYNLKVVLIADPYRGQGVNRQRMAAHRPDETGPCIDFFSTSLLHKGLQSYLKESGNLTLVSARTKLSRF